MSAIVAWFDQRELYSLGRLIAGLLCEPVDTLKACFYYGFLHVNPKKLSLEEQKARPILFLHGNRHNSSAWIPFIRRMKKEGIGPCFTVELPSDEITEKDFQIIEDQLDKIKSLGNLQTPILVGHSRGAKLAIQMGLRLDFHKIIAIGTPATKEEARRLPNLYEIDALHDILVEERSILNDSLVAKCGHVGLLYSKEVMDAVIEQMGQNEIICDKLFST